jgi:hypothetical protein
MWRALGCGASAPFARAREEEPSARPSAASLPRMPERSRVAIICASFATRSVDASHHRGPCKMSSRRRGTIGIDQTQAQPDKAAVGAALAVLDRFMAALNADDKPALLATLHFPHYRLAGGRKRVWDQPVAYLADFLVRAGADWHHSEWDFRRVIAARPAKVAWTYNSPAIASIIRLLARSVRYGSSPSPAGSGPCRRGRASQTNLRMSRATMNLIA